MRYLRRNIENNNIQDRVTTIEAALSEQEGTVRLTIGKDAVNRVAGQNEAGTREVRALSLDGMLAGQRSTMKGGEMGPRNSALLAVEIESEMIEDAIRAMLESVGFKQFCYDPWSRALQPAEGQKVAIRIELLICPRRRRVPTPSRPSG